MINFITMNTVINCRIEPTFGKDHVLTLSFRALQSLLLEAREQGRTNFEALYEAWQQKHLQQVDRLNLSEQQLFLNQKFLNYMVDIINDDLSLNAAPVKGITNCNRYAYTKINNDSLNVPLLSDYKPL